MKSYLREATEQALIMTNANPYESFERLSHGVQHQQQQQQLHHDFSKVSRSQSIAIKRTSSSSNQSECTTTSNSACHVENDSEESLQQLYAYKTWNMYYRITEHRKHYGCTVHDEEEEEEAYEPAYVMDKSIKNGSSLKFRNQNHNQSMSLASMAPSILYSHNTMNDRVPPLADAEASEYESSEDLLFDLEL